MSKHVLYPLLLLLLLLDLGYSFHQHYHVALDGDMAGIILPSEWYQPVLNDPFGLQVLLKGDRYAAPNRFFAHWTMSHYFKTTPFFFQRFISPIDSIYATAALAKTLIQLFIIWLLATYISGKGNPFRREFLVAAVLITPLFQASGYNTLMGIIDKSITYNFFFALPLGLLLLFFLPFFRSQIQEQKQTFRPVHISLLFLLAIVLSFNGPLIPAIVLLVCPAAILYQWRRKELSRPLLFTFLFISALSLYSFFIGTHNAENFAHSISLKERYLLVPQGLFSLFTLKLGPPLLLSMVMGNLFLLSRFKENPEAQKIRRVAKWIGLFAIVYILLLPLGGYREYRPNIVRRDTLMPLFLCLFFLYGWSAYFLIYHLQPRLKKWYLGVLAGFLLLFTVADEPIFTHNACERQGLEILSRSTEAIVRLPVDCTVLSWVPIADTKDSEWNAQLLEYWGVTKGKKLYYQE